MWDGPQLCRRPLGPVQAVSSLKLGAGAWRSRAWKEWNQTREGGSEARAPGGPFQEEGSTLSTERGSSV